MFHDPCLLSEALNHLPLTGLATWLVVQHWKDNHRRLNIVTRGFNEVPLAACPLAFSRLSGSCGDRYLHTYLCHVPPFWVHAVQL